ncbi:MAG: phosphotransferase [Pseudomonadales bacterium]|nr:phosphotransferase family protein [Pseudomonadales bacterium]NIX09897.1 phosphotransferase [Pseudomonadales bacterium]
MTGALDALGGRFAAYLADRWERPVTTLHIEQIPGGASRETYRIKVAVEGDEQGLILRRDPVSSLIETERSLEYRTYEAVFPTSIPVPEPLLLEEDAAPLERPFSVMREIGGCESSAQALAAPPYLAVRETIGQRKWEILGQLASLDVSDLGVDAFMAVPDHSARQELDQWSAVIAKDALHPQPIAEATRRWLERNLPEPASRLALVHGDYRSGNFLYDEDGVIKGVLDWEMAHIGDPLEDLAWSLDPLWSWPERELAGSLLPREQAIRVWEEASGLTVDRAAFRWWQVFASYKGLAIWISSTEDFVNGASKEPILAVAGWLMTDRQNRILVDRLSPGSEHAYAEPIV